MLINKLSLLFRNMEELNLQLIFVIFIFIIGVIGGGVGLAYISKNKFKGKKKYMLFIVSMFFCLVALFALLHILATLVLLISIK